MADRGIPQIAGSPPNPRAGANTSFPNRGMGTFKRKSGTEPIHAPYDLLEEPLHDSRRPEKMARLYEESVGFENMANQKFVAEQAVQAVKSSLDDVFNILEFQRNKWLMLYRLYRGETLNHQFSSTANLHSPEPYKIIETLHPKVMRTLFGEQRWFKLYGHNEQHDANARAQEVLCRDQLREAKYVAKASRFVRDGLIYGTSIQKCYWKQTHGEMRYRKAKRVQRKDFPGTTEVELEETKRVELVFDGNYTDNVSIFDFLTSPMASSIEEAEWCADRSSWPDWKVKRQGELGHWINLAGLKDHPGSHSASSDDEMKERKAYTYGVFDPRHASHAPHIPHYEVIDWWGPLLVSDKNGSYETKLCNVVMVEPESLALVVRVTVCPFWHQQKPYQAWRPVNIEDEFYGIGALEPIARLSMEKDMKRSLLMQSTQLEANPAFLISDDANVSDSQLILQPGLGLRVPDIQNSIAPLHIPQVSDSALKAENVLTKDIRETSGATSPSMGATDPFAKDKTATQHMAESDEANLRLVPLILNFEEEVVKPMIEQMVWNNQQFASYPKVVRELGAIGQRFHDHFEVRPEDLIGRFLVQAIASHRLTTKQTQVQQLVNFLDRAPVINQMHGPGTVNTPKLMAMILEQGFDIRNVDDFIKMPPEDSGILSAMEEHELWYHGHVPSRRPDDNDLRHVMNHQEEIGTERFQKLEEHSPATAARVRAHIADHVRKIAMLQEMQEKIMMEQQQQATMLGMAGPGGGSPIAGAAGPGQDPGSPQVRANETERGEGGEGGVKSEAMASAPNKGAE